MSNIELQPQTRGQLSPDLLPAAGQPQVESLTEQVGARAVQTLTSGPKALKQRKGQERCPRLAVLAEKLTVGKDGLTRNDYEHQLSAASNRFLNRHCSGDPARREGTINRNIFRVAPAGYNECGSIGVVQYDDELREILDIATLPGHEEDFIAYLVEIGGPCGRCHVAPFSYLGGKQVSRKAAEQARIDNEERYLFFNNLELVEN